MYWKIWKNSLICTVVVSFISILVLTNSLTIEFVTNKQDTVIKWFPTYLMPYKNWGKKISNFMQTNFFQHINSV